MSTSMQTGSFNSGDTSNVSNTTATKGTNTTTPGDTLGLGALLAGQGGSTASSDAATNVWLQNMMNNGPTQLQGQVSQAVNNATSGPGLVGAGVGANARAGGDAAAEIGLNAAGLQENAAQQLRSPTGVDYAAGASVPFNQVSQGVDQTAHTEGTVATNSSGTSAGTGQVNTTPQSTSPCCFILLQSLNGELPTYVRLCRDAFYTPKRRNGYIRVARFLVPAMRLSSKATKAVNFVMVKPFLKCGNWFTKFDVKLPGYKYGWVYKPVCYAWFFVFDVIGGI